MSVEDFGVTTKCRDTIEERKRLQLVLSIVWAFVVFVFVVKFSDRVLHFIIDIMFINGMLGMFYLLTPKKGFLGQVFGYIPERDISVTYWYLSGFAVICAVILLGTTSMYRDVVYGYISANYPMPEVVNLFIHVFAWFVILVWLYVFGLCVRNYVKLGRFHPNREKAG
ncbi:MAG: hypothetical protein CMF60_00180 [Magnetococcales bacterium]|nr:hypothetical protein [Magnetococcales bacterium]|tara:strand:- start:7773 stop:8276 length:504 start_codon:yes stop_codon:yes gene_type:complete